MATAPFWLGMRAGARPGIGTTVRVHAIMDNTTMESVCGRGTPFGWAGPSGGSAVSTDLGQVTCGQCLAALTQQNLPPSS